MRSGSWRSRKSAAAGGYSTLASAPSAFMLTCTSTILGAAAVRDAVSSLSVDWSERYVAHLQRLARLTRDEDRAEYRRRVTERDPLMFALIYLRKHLRDPRGGTDITLSEVHLDWARLAATWANGTPTMPATDRDAFLAPRGLGKSTWWYLCFPMWSAAHRHVGFVAAFADTSTQAESHLSTFKSELDRNALIRNDYPELVEPMQRPGNGATVADNRGMMQTRSGFVFTARGVDSGNLGMKVGERRPDVIICDDLEPGESNYSGYQVGKRLGTLTDDILALNVFARVIIVGTTTMSGSVADQLREYAEQQWRGEGASEQTKWVGEEHFTVHLTPAIATNDDGTRRSIWPEKWSLEWLEEREHTREFRKNYALSPLGADGGFWTEDDIERGTLDGVTRILVSIDPAVTSKSTSDYTGIAVVGWSPTTNRCIVLDVRQVRLVGEALRTEVLRTIERHNAGLVLVETNQGGELWNAILHHMPVKVKTVHQTESKPARAADAFAHYQRHRVVHLAGAKLADFEAQLVAFPHAPHDDMVDAVTTATLYFLARKKRRVEPGGVSVGYAA